MDEIVYTRNNDAVRMPKRVIRTMYRHYDQVDAFSFAKYCVRLSDKETDTYKVDAFLSSGLKARTVPTDFSGREEANGWIDKQIRMANA